MKLLRHRTFTLIEMLIVIVIIGILAAALIPRLQSVQERARDTKRKVDFQQLATALEIYKIDKSTYPTPFYYGNPNNNCINSGYIACHTNSYYGGTVWMYWMTGGYMSSIPLDPRNISLIGGGSVMDGPWWRNYFAYSYLSNGKVYSLITRLENRNDPERCPLKGTTVYDDSGYVYNCTTIDWNAFAQNNPTLIDAVPMYVISSSNGS